jgi:hypothetical protein
MAKPKKIEAPQWKAEFRVGQDHFYADVSRIETTKDSMFFRLERQSFAIPLSVVKKIIKTGA